MTSRPPNSDDTLATEDAAIASDATIDQAANATPPQVTTGRVIRVSRASIGPSQLGRYTIVRPLGRGGMGAVYEADDPELGRHVAIKVLRDDRDNEVFTESLRREAQALAKLVHPNVVGVYDVGVDEGRVFVVMQLIEGEAIDHWLEKRPVRAIEVVDAFRQAGKGLAAAHAAGLVHCDFKPSNVLVDRAGVIRVSDFGLARIGAQDAGSVAGTPAYMAPEQFTGVATSASDQYAFCVSLYEVLTGAKPFPDSKIDLADEAKARTVPPIPRSARVPAFVIRALVRGLAPDAANRFPSMDALLAALAPPIRRWWIAATAAALVLAAVAVAMAALRSPAVVERAPDARPPALPDLAAAHALTTYGTSACAYAPSIDGDNVVFDRTQGDAVDLYVMPLAGGQPRQLTSAPTWEWRSNPGRHRGEAIHVIQDPNDVDAAKLAYVDTASGRETIAASVAASDAGVTTGGIVYVQSGGEGLRQIKGDRDVVLVRATEGRLFGQIAISHAGDRIAAVASKGRDGNLCLIDAITGTTTCVDAHALAIRPAFGIDDRRVYYSTIDGIHGRDLATGVDALIIPEVIPLGGLAITSDGHALVYSDCGTRSQIVDRGTEPPTLLVDDPRARDPSGVTTSTVIWLRGVRGGNVLVARAQDGHETQLTDADFGSITSAAISPDGARVAFSARPPHPGVYVASFTGEGEIQRISDNPRDVNPAWIGNDLLAFNRVDDHDLSTVFTASADGANLHSLPGSSGSSRFAVGGYNHKVLVATTRRLYWVDAVKGVEHDGPSLDLQVSGVVSSPNGHWLVVRSGSQGHVLYRISLVPPGKLERLPPVPSGRTIDGATITDDGHVLAAEQTWSGDLHVIPAKSGAPF